MESLSEQYAVIVYTWETLRGPAEVKVVVPAGEHSFWELVDRINEEAERLTGSEVISE